MVDHCYDVWPILLDTGKCCRLCTEPFDWAKYTCYVTISETSFIFRRKQLLSLIVYHNSLKKTYQCYAIKC